MTDYEIKTVLVSLGEPYNGNLRPVIRRAFRELGDRKVYSLVLEALVEFGQWTHVYDPTMKTSTMGIFLRKLKQTPQPLKKRIFKGP